MQAGTEYAVIKALCDTCGHKWVAVVEVQFVELAVKEYKIPALECPVCGHFTESHNRRIE